MNNRIAILLAVVLGLIAAFAVHMHVKSQEAKARQRFETTEIVVAAKTIKPGDEIRLAFGPEGMLAYKEYPENAIVTGMVTPDMIKRYKGAIVRKRIERNAPILKDNLELDVEKAVSQTAIVEPGMRAVTIPVDTVSGAAGLLSPGDHVDLIATFELRSRRGAAREASGAKTLFLLQNARIIALDTRTESPASARLSKRARNYRTVTLAVSPADAMRISNAEQQGRIKLLLRNRTDTGTVVDSVGEGEEAKPIAWDVLDELENLESHTDAAGTP